MKKRLIYAAVITSLLLGACEKAKPVKEEAKKLEKTSPAAVEVAKNNLTLKFSNLKENLPDYFAIRSQNMYENALIVYTDKTRGSYLIAREITAYIKKNYDMDSEIIKDTDVSKSKLIDKNLFVIGNVNNNKLLTVMEEYLPVKADGKKVYLGDKVYSGKNLGATYFYPNLYDLNRSMVLIMGNSDTALKMYDFKKYDIAIAKGLDQILPFNFKEVAFAKFDKNWNIKDVREISADELKTGEEKVVRAGEPAHYPFPEWAKGKIIYQIFPRSFYDSDGDNIGDLQGIKEKLDYIKSLGTEVIWLTPIFDSPSYHGYNITDYKKINPEFGTNEDFRELAMAVHEKGMKIILDMALNHASVREKHFVDAYNNPDSEYDRWFYFANIQNNLYHGWNFREDPNDRDTANSDLPAWNTNNPEVIDYHTDVLKFWLDPNGDGDTSDGVDGYRMDYVKGPSHAYWKIIRKRLKEENPDIFLLAEAWVDLNKMANYFDDEFDAAFDFALQGALTSKISRDIYRTLNEQEATFPDHAVLARFLSNHDLERMPSSMTQEEMKAYSTMMYTLKGMPTIYYGDELGQKGHREHSDKDLRKPMEWYKNNKGPGFARWTSPYNEEADGVSVEEQDGVEGSLLEHYRKLARLKKQYTDIFDEGKLTLLKAYKVKNGNERTAGKTVAYSIKAGEKEAIVIMNLWKAAEDIRIDFTDKLVGKEFEEVLNGKSNLVIDNSKLDMTLEAYTPYIYIKK